MVTAIFIFLQLGKKRSVSLEISVTNLLIVLAATAATTATSEHNKGEVEHFHSLRLTGRQGARCARIIYFDPAA